MQQSNPYSTDPVEIVDVFDEYSDIKTYTLRFKDDKKQKEFDFNPGQFLEVSLNGIGEAPISINSSPTQEESFNLCVEEKGSVTSAMFKRGEGSTVFVRGPYGNGFPVDEAKGKDILFVAGGIGLAPLRSAIEYVYEDHEEYGDVQIMYGDKTPVCLLFNRHFSKWEENFDLNVICEETGPEWTGEEGVVTDLLDYVNLDIENAVSFMCGPPVMYRFVLPELKDIGFEDEDIYLSLERRMECGFGKCRRCNVGDKFVCKDGPVFPYDEIKEFVGKET
jgi:NAD(P)H-flavin reductase